MPLTMYLDGSRTNGVMTTLGAVVADESVWSELTQDWSDVLSRHGVSHSHMKELTGGIGPFAGWNAAQRVEFLTALVRALERFGPSDRIRQYACWVDLAAHAKWSKARSHPSPERLCARILFPTFVANFPGVIDAIDMWFDRNEGFMTHLREDWQNPTIRKDVPVWSIVQTIGATDMAAAPPLQIADLVAWSRNRYQVVGLQQLADGSGIDPFTVLAARVLNHGLRGEHREVGEKAMAESRFPEEGLRRLRLFESARRRHR